VAERYYYDAYGKAHLCNPSWTEIGWANSYENEVLYAGYRYDWETGLYNVRNREYHPTLGRWTSEDPIDYVGGPNLYSYCNDNPAVTTDPSGLMDLEKVERGIAGLFEGAIEFLSASDTAIPSAMMAKGYGDFLLGINKTVQGLRDKPGLGAPASVAEGVVDAVSLGLTGERSQTARDLIDVADSMFSGAASGYLRGAAAQGPNTYKMGAPSSGAPPYQTWNQFQAGTAGQFATRAEAAQAWGAYKQANCFVTGSVRSQGARSQFLRSLADDYRTASSMKPWLERGQVPPGYEVDHIKPLSVGGEQVASNMRLQAVDLHRLHHRFYRPWEAGQ